FVIGLELLRSGFGLRAQLGVINQDVSDFAFFRDRIGVNLLVAVVIGLQFTFAGMYLLLELVRTERRILKFYLRILAAKLLLQVICGYIRCASHHVPQPLLQDSILDD